MPAAEQLRIETRAATLLGRLVLAELIKWSLENADLRSRLHRRRPQRRHRALKVSAVALGLGAAGLAARRARHDDAPPVT
jgi:hypothetical protein